MSTQLSTMKEIFQLVIEYGTPNTWLVIKSVPTSWFSKFKLNEWHNWKHLQSIHVSRKLRGQGIGTELMDRACAIADKLGYSLVLRVQPFDGCPLTKDQLRDFYRSWGFMEDMEKKDMMVRIAPAILEAAGTHVPMAEVST